MGKEEPSSAQHQQMATTSGPQAGALQQEQHSGEPPAKRTRVYQNWQGNEKFFLWGYLVAGPNWRASLGTAFLLLAPSGIFLGFVAPYVAFRTHVIILVFSCLLPVLCGVFLFLTACRDPGIIPRQEPDDEYLSGRKPRTQEVMVNGHRVVIRYNDTCHFYQPPRAHHCSVNDNCIERFDHHCPWVGTTIGKRNYRTFLLFIFTATVLCLYVMGVCLAQLFLKHQELVDDQRAAGNNVPSDSEWGQAFRDVIPAVVLMFYTFLFVWFVGGLSGFHCYLVGTNQTTYENFRYNHDSRPNPFDRGVFSNCAEVWCTPIPASQVDFRAFVDELPHHHQGAHASQQGDGSMGGGDMEMGHVGRGSYNAYNVDPVAAQQYYHPGPGYEPPPEYSAHRQQQQQQQQQQGLQQVPQQQHMAGEGEGEGYDPPNHHHQGGVVPGQQQDHSQLSGGGGGGGMYGTSTGTDKESDDAYKQAQAGVVGVGVQR